MIKNFLSILFITSVFFVNAQDVSEMQNQLRELAKEKNPLRAVERKAEILSSYPQIADDTETTDMIYGMIAVAWAGEGKFDMFYKYIDSIQNKFNQTSMMNMAASQLLSEDKYTSDALRIAKETLDLYFSFKDDPGMRPAHFEEADWKRFMNFAQYPYYDSYAQALYKSGKFDSALIYQKKAFDGPPEEGLGKSVERLVHLLLLTGKEKEAKNILFNMAKAGKLTSELSGRLEELYVKENGNSQGFEAYLDNLQQQARKEMLAGLKEKMYRKTAPAFSLKNLKGETVSLSDYKGKIVILDLWATWCAPCIASFPAMQKLVNKHTEVEFLFIVVDEKGNNALDRVKNFISRNNYNFHVLMDEPVSAGSDKYIITSTYRPDGIPAKYFIDQNGDLRYQSKGFDSDNELVNEVEAIIEILLSN